MLFCVVWCESVQWAGVRIVGCCCRLSFAGCAGLFLPLRLRLRVLLLLRCLEKASASYTVQGPVKLVIWRATRSKKEFLYPVHFFRNIRVRARTNRKRRENVGRVLSSTDISDQSSRDAQSSVQDCGRVLVASGALYIANSDDRSESSWKSSQPQELHYQSSVSANSGYQESSCAQTHISPLGLPPVGVSRCVKPNSQGDQEGDCVSSCFRTTIGANCQKWRAGVEGRRTTPSDPEPKIKKVG